MSKLKVYVVGGYGYNEISWMQNAVIEQDFNKADIIWFCGGGDWSSSYYNQKAGSHTSDIVSKRDKTEEYYFKRAIDQNKFIWGTCRGIQGCTIFAGGSLVQHVRHPSFHKVYTDKGETYGMNSCHHQLCNPYNLPEKECEVISYTLGESPIHLGEEDKQVIFPDIAYTKEGILKEPEVIWFPKIKALGAQGHFEWMPNNCDGNKFINKIVKELFIKQKEHVNG